MEEDKQNENSDVEKEMDDDGHRLLIIRVIKDRTMPMDSEAPAYVQNSGFFTGYKNELENGASESNRRSSPLLHTSIPLGGFHLVHCHLLWERGSHNLVWQNRHIWRTHPYLESYTKNAGRYGEFPFNLPS